VLTTKDNIEKKLPENLKDLAAVAYNFWHTWSRSAMKLWSKIDPDLWKAYQNPVKLLLETPSERLEELSKDEDFLSLYELVTERFHGYMKESNTWFNANYPNWDTKFVYMCMEYGISEALPIYSGGLGILAGDHLKSASDLGIPLIAVGLLYKHGYFVQEISSDLTQQELFPQYSPEDLPITPLLDAEGKPVLVKVPLDDQMITVRVFQADVGRVKLYLLDPDTPETPPEYRLICDYLYNPGMDIRVAQEILLGVGGIRLLKELNIEPGLVHLNEGHPAFAAFERIKDLMQKGLSFEESLEVVKESTVFTTHTPVPAGHDKFPVDFIYGRFRSFFEGLPADKFLSLGKETENSGELNMTVLAIRTSAYVNGVSQLHARVSREMFRNLWKGYTLEEVPIEGITNGVHTLTWICSEFSRIYDRALSRVWREHTDLEGMWYGVERISDADLWEAHLKAKKNFISLMKDKIQSRNKRLNLSDPLPEIDENSLIIGFGRRFATYKRAILIFRDLERLKKILNTPGRPVYLVFAGKAHPNDGPGKEFLSQVLRMTKEPGLAGKVFFLENYDISLARAMVSGVDVWLNTPRRPQEASGTSGMKAAINGVLNLSIYDGWWVEGYNGKNGWVVGDESLEPEHEENDQRDSESLYNILETQIIPTYYENRTKWLSMMRESIKSIVPRFSTHRMVKEYMDKTYVKAFINSERLSKNDFENAKRDVNWESRVVEAWNGVSVKNVAVEENGASLRVTVNLGQLSPEDVKVELFLGREGTELEKVRTVELRRYVSEGDSTFTYFYTDGFLRHLGNPCWKYFVRILPDTSDTDIIQHVPIIWYVIQ